MQTDCTAHTDNSYTCGWRSFFLITAAWVLQLSSVKNDLACKLVVRLIFFTRMAKCVVLQFGVIIAIMFLCLLPTTVFVEAFMWSLNRVSNQKLYDPFASSKSGENAQQRKKEVYRKEGTHTVVKVERDLMTFSQQISLKSAVAGKWQAVFLAGFFFSSKLLTKTDRNESQFVSQDVNSDSLWAFIYAETSQRGHSAAAVIPLCPSSPSPVALWLPTLGCGGSVTFQMIGKKSALEIDVNSRSRARAHVSV